MILYDSLVPVAESPPMILFSHLSPVKNSQCFCSLVQIITAILAALAEMPQAGSVPISGHFDPNFATIPSKLSILIEKHKLTCPN